MIFFKISFEIQICLHSKFKHLVLGYGCIYQNRLVEQNFHQENHQNRYVIQEIRFKIIIIIFIFFLDSDSPEIPKQLKLRFRSDVDKIRLAHKGQLLRDEDKIASAGWTQKLYKRDRAPSLKRKFV